MVMAAPPLFASIETTLAEAVSDVPIILMSPSGERAAEARRRIRTAAAFLDPIAAEQDGRTA